jgi:membrane associated rhomboid family serine protease
LLACLLALLACLLACFCFFKTLRSSQRWFQVEFVAGFWRTAVMYLVSGSCGFMISALFSADNISNGASAAIYGMLGVETVEWQTTQPR